MDFENVAALTIGKEYTIKKVEGDSIVLESEVSDGHYFNMYGEQAWHNFFNKKDVK